MPDMALPDGRRLAFESYGDAAGRHALYCHGFPTSHHEARLIDGAARRHGFRVAAPDRPGYGGSSPRTMEGVADWVDDAGALLDELNWPRVVVIGVSGGGPYALACAARLPERVAAVVLVGALGPVGEVPLRRAMTPLARLGFWLAAAAPALLGGIFTVAGRLLARWPGLLRLGLGAWGPAADRRVLARDDVQRALLAGVADALGSGGGAAAAELARYARPWGFDLAAVGQPVLLWHGTADHVVPVQHARRLAADLPDVSTHLLVDEGHFSVPVAYTDDIMAALDAALDASP
ncbi:MAG: alpha/beta fold hydrolase [Gammaproteobacteria bacterium]|nr:alpha/beta fold hydrolase [Gammaproteobacteria bacterium]